MDDMDHLAVIGAGSAVAVPARLNLGTVRAISQAPGWMANATPQGVSTPAEELDFLPLSYVDFTNPGPGRVDHDAFIEAFPQRPFRGERLVLQAVYIPAAGAPYDALFQMVISPAMYVGAVQVGATQGQMPAAAFGPTAFGVRLSMPTAGQGTRVYLPFSFRGVGPGDRIYIAGGVFGRAVR